MEHFNTRQHRAKKTLNDSLRHRFQKCRGVDATEREELRERMRQFLDRLLDDHLQQLRPGQGLGVMVTFKVVNRDWSFTDEPNARLSPEAKEWRAAVVKRANGVCEECGQPADELNAHHKESWAKHPERRFDPSNGVALCPKCHAGKHPQQSNLILKAAKHRKQKREERTKKIQAGAEAGD